MTIVFDDRAFAEDAAQTGFERALRRWRTVATHDRPDTWVYVVAVRHGRRQLARRADQRTWESEAPDAPSPEAEVVGAEGFEDLLRQLPPRQRAAVVLRHLDGLPLADIAEALGVSVGTVKSSLHSAYRSLRVELAGEVEAKEVRDGQR